MPDISDGAAFDDYAPDDWDCECYECGYIFWFSSAWSEVDDSGVLCPHCGAFVPDDDGE